MLNFLFNFVKKAIKEAVYAPVIGKGNKTKKNKENKVIFSYFLILLRTFCLYHL